MPRDFRSLALARDGHVRARGASFVLAAAALLLAAPTVAAQSGGSVYHVTLGSPRHTISHTKGGVIWQPLSRNGHKMAGDAIEQLGTPHAAFLHWEHHAGWRFDLARFEPDVQLYNFVHYRSLEELFGYYEKPNTVWVLPVGLSSYSTVSGTTYPWITPAYSAAFVQYVCGTADPAPTAPGWGNNDFHDPAANPGYNWANLRALRGRAQPWPCAHVLAGTEPIGAEALDANQGQDYVNKFVPFFDELERRFGTPLPFRISIFIGGENLYSHWVAKVLPAAKPYLLRNRSGLVINNRFDPSGSAPIIEQILWRSSVKVGGTAAWWYPQVGMTGPERQFIGPEYSAALVDLYGLPPDTKNHIYWGSWTQANLNGPNNVYMMLMYAVNYGLAFSGGALPSHTSPAHVNYDSPWTWAAIWDGKAFVSLQKDDVTVERTPAYFMHRVFGDGFSGNQLVNYTLTGGNKVTMAWKNPSFEAYELQLWITKRPNNDLELWAVNTSDVNTHTVTGLEAYFVTRWERVKGSFYTEENQASSPQITNQLIAQSTLTFAPLSVNRVALSLTPTVRFWGDVTRDAVVNSADALGTLSYSVGLPNPNHDFSVADVNADGQITTLDALIDLYYAVGLDVSAYRVGKPVSGSTGDLVASPRGARVPLSDGGRVQMDLRASALPAKPSTPGAGRTTSPGAPAGLRLVLEAVRHDVVEEIGAFRVRLTWDPRILRFRSAAPRGDEGQVLLGVNEAEADLGSLTLAAATPGAFGSDLLEIEFESPASAIAGAAAARVELEVLELTGAGSGRDLRRAVEIVAQKVADDAPGGGGLEGDVLGLPYPNPSSGRVRIPLRVGQDAGASLAGAEGVDVELTVYDLRGRKIRRLVEGEVAPGQQTVEWDATDGSGRRVPAGIYVVELRSDRERKVRKIVIF